MSLPILTSNRVLFAKIMTGWIPFKVYRKLARAIMYMGVRKWVRIMRTDKKRTFPHELSIVATMKNEGPYLKEWLDFHILVGVEKFYLYDNDSTDDTKTVLAPYIRRGIVEYIPWPGVGQQNNIYVDALNKFAEETRWMAIVDVDEFIVPVMHNTIPEFLKTLPPRFGLLVLTWIMYGSGGHRKKPDGLVIENYKYHGDKTRAAGCKSIVNPRLVVRQSNPHINEVAGFVIDENGKKLGTINQTYNPPSSNKIRINHYAVKSYDEFIARGRQGNNNGRNTRTPDMFAAKDTNDIYSPIMDKYIDRLKEM